VRYHSLTGTLTFTVVVCAKNNTVDAYHALLTLSVRQPL
jgi:hypothetical protein